jgi:XTP/dITP diphosphohydrolase
MSIRLNSPFVLFATNNINKFNEARLVLSKCGITVGMLRIKSLEIQSESLEYIAEASVLEAVNKSRLPLVVEDAGLFVEALNGFPGPYAAYVYKTIGNKGLLKLLDCMGNRKATFESVVAYFSPKMKSPVSFDGAVSGEVVRKERSMPEKAGFGFDPVFKPDGSRKTFAQMNIQEKCQYSHRAAAFLKFAEWYGQSLVDKAHSHNQ